jgi:glyoxylase-like metal-dependent hydrolase (beta-lactamase superfamily II)
MKMEIIAGGSIMTNSYILYNDNTAIAIDFVPEIVEFLNKNDLKLEKLLLTHIHFDHIEELSIFQQENAFDLYLSEPAFHFLKNPNLQLLSIFPANVVNNIKNIKLDNTVVVNNNDQIEWDNYKIFVYSSPGHSPDSLIYILKEEKKAFTGDTIFYGSIGRTDLPGGSYNQIIESIVNFYKLIEDDYDLYPGHGPKTNAGFEKKNNPFFSEYF